MQMSIGAYQQIQTTTADPAQLVLQLFDGAIRRLGQAVRALERGDGAGFARAVSGANAIIAELASTLDVGRGGELAGNLGRLYEFMLRHLTVALVRRSRAEIETVVGLLHTLREGFEGAAEASRGRP